MGTRDEKTGGIYARNETQLHPVTFTRLGAPPTHIVGTHQRARSATEA